MFVAICDIAAVIIFAFAVVCYGLGLNWQLSAFCALWIKLVAIAARIDERR